MLFVNLLIIAIILVLNYFYQRNGFDFTLKCICSAGFFLLGLINLIYAFITGAKGPELLYWNDIGTIPCYAWRYPDRI